MIPFYTGPLFGALANRHGTAFAEPDGLRLTFREGRVEVRAPELDIESLLLPWNEVQQVKARHGLVEDRLVVRTTCRSARETLAVPEEKDLELQVQKQHRERLDGFAKKAEALRSGRGGRTDVEAAIDDIQDFLDGI